MSDRLTPQQLSRVRDDYNANRIMYRRLDYYQLQRDVDTLVNEIQRLWQEQTRFKEHIRWLIQVREEEGGSPQGISVPEILKESITEAYVNRMFCSGSDGLHLLLLVEMGQVSAIEAADLLRDLLRGIPVELPELR